MLLAIHWWPTLPLFTELPRRLVFSETQQARGGKKTAGALEETRLCLSAYYERAFRKGVAAAPRLSMRYGLPDPPAHQRKKAVGQHGPRNHQGHVEEVVNVD